MNILKNQKVQNDLLPGMHEELVRANSIGDRVHAQEVIRGIEAIRSLFPVPTRWEIAA